MSGLILCFWQELADYQGNPDSPKLSTEDLERDGFDIKPPLFHAYVAESEDEPGALIGYAVYHYAYGTWTGRKTFLRDLCVTESHRKCGLGYALMRKVIEKTVEMNCQQMDFLVYNWNPARDFYFKLGAVDISVSEGWQVCRTNLPQMVAFLSHK